MEEEYVSVTHQRVYLKDSLKRLSTIMMLLMASVAIVVWVMIWIFSHPPKPVYFQGFPVPSQSQAPNILDRYVMMPQPSLDKPFLTDNQLLLWANRVAAQVYSFNFFDYQTHMSSLVNYFTPTGWPKFQAAMKASQILESVVNNSYIVNAVIPIPPTIIQQQALNGRYYWRVKVPMRTNFRSSISKTNLRFTLDMVITRMPLSVQTPHAVAIESFNVTDVVKPR